MKKLNREETLANSSLQVEYTKFLQEQFKNHRIDNIADFRKKVSEFTKKNAETYRCFEYGEEEETRINYGVILPLVRKEFKELENNYEYSKKLLDLIRALKRIGFCPPTIGELDKWCEAKNLTIKSNFFDIAHNYYKEYEQVCNRLQKMLDKKGELSYDDINEENFEKVQERFEKVKNKLESNEVNMRITYALPDEGVEGVRRVMAVNPFFQPDIKIDKNYTKEIARINSDKKIGWLSKDFFEIERKLEDKKIKEVQGWINSKNLNFHCWQQPDLDLLHFIKQDENKIASFEKNLPKELIERNIFSLYVAPRETYEKEFKYCDIDGNIKTENITTYFYAIKPFNFMGGTNGTGAFAKSDVPSTWLTYKQACYYAKNQIIFNKIMEMNRHNGSRISLNGKAVFSIGIPLNGDGWVAIDIDHCIDEDGIMDNRAIKMMENLKGYWEYSASGTGIHGLFKLPQEYINEFPRSRFRNEDGLDIEFYKKDRIMSITGMPVDKYKVLTPEENKEMFSSNIGLITPYTFTNEEISQRINVAREGSFTRNSVILNVAFESQNELYLRDDEIVAKVIHMQKPKMDKLICDKIYEDLEKNKDDSRLYEGTPENDKDYRLNAIQTFIKNYSMNPYKLMNKNTNEYIDEKLVEALANQSISGKKFNEVVKMIEQSLKPLYDMKKSLENSSIYSNPFERASIHADFQNKFLYSKYGDDRSKIEGSIIDMIAYFTTSPSQIKRIMENYTNMSRNKWYEERFSVTYTNEQGKTETLNNIPYIDSLIISAVSNYNTKIRHDREIYDGRTDKIWNPYSERERRIIEERKKNKDINFGKSILNKYEIESLEKHKEELTTTKVNIEEIDRNRANHSVSRGGGVSKTQLDPATLAVVEKNKKRYGGVLFDAHSPYAEGTTQKDIAIDYERMISDRYKDSTETSASTYFNKINKKAFEEMVNNENKFVEKCLEKRPSKIELLKKIDVYLTREKELER